MRAGLASMVVILTICVTSVAPRASAQSIGPLVRSWAIERMTANAESAPEERTLGCQGLKVVSGISCRAIDERGTGGGENSVLRRPLGTFGKQIGLDIKLF